MLPPASEALQFLLRVHQRLTPRCACAVWAQQTILKLSNVIQGSNRRSNRRIDPRSGAGNAKAHQQHQLQTSFSSGGGRRALQQAAVVYSTTGGQGRARARSAAAAAAAAASVARPRHTLCLRADSCPSLVCAPSKTDVQIPPWFDEEIRREFAQQRGATRSLHPFPANPRACRAD